MYSNFASTSSRSNLIQLGRLDILTFLQARTAKDTTISSFGALHESPSSHLAYLSVLMPW
jgi:hypothetical protein